MKLVRPPKQPKEREEKIIKMTLFGQIRGFITLKALGKRCGKSLDYMLKLEERKILPTANWRTPEVNTKTGKTIPGARAYTLELVERVVHILKTESPGQGTPFSESTKQKLRDLFGEERSGQLFTN